MIVSAQGMDNERLLKASREILHMNKMNSHWNEKDPQVI